MYDLQYISHIFIIILCDLYYNWYGGNSMITITATEFKKNFGKYLELVKTEDIEVTKNGNVIGVFYNPIMRDFESLFGSLKGVTYDKKDIREMRLNERYNLDD